MDPDQQLRNLRDFLLVYNRMTEICFKQCSTNFNYRILTMDEERCVDNCAGKMIRSNHRLMGTYVQLMPRMVQRRMEEMEAKAAESAKAAEAAGAGAGPVEGSGVEAPALPEAPPAAETATPSSVSPEVPAFIPPAVTDTAPVDGPKPSVLGQLTDIPSLLTPSPVVGQIAMPEVPSPVSMPTGSDISLESGPVFTPQVTENGLTATTTLTPAAEAVIPPVLSKAIDGPPLTVAPPLEMPFVVPQPPLLLVPDAPTPSISSGIASSQSIDALSRPVTLSEEPTLSTVAAPTLPQVTESLSDTNKSPKLAPVSPEP